MKKYLLFAIFFLISANFAISGPLEYFAHQDTVYGTIYDDELLAKARIRNLTDQPVEFELRFEFLQLTPGHTAAVCWEVCFEFTDESFKAPWNITLGPNEESIDFQFSGHLQSFKLISDNPIEYTEPAVGTTIVRFIFAPVNGTAEDELHYDVVFIVTDPASVNDIFSDAGLSFYPNPSNDFLNLNLQNPLMNDASISIYDINGSLINSFRLEAGLTSRVFDVSYLPVGSYYMNIRSDKYITNRKFNIVR